MYQYLIATAVIAITALVNPIAHAGKSADPPRVSCDYERGTCAVTTAEGSFTVPLDDPSVTNKVCINGCCVGCNKNSGSAWCWVKCGDNPQYGYQCDGVGDCHAWDPM